MGDVGIEHEQLCIHYGAHMSVHQNLIFRSLNISLAIRPVNALPDITKKREREREKIVLRYCGGVDRH